MSEVTTSANSVDPPRVIRYKQAALLLEKWLDEESEYDAQTWNHLQDELQDANVQCGDADENSA